MHFHGLVRTKILDFKYFVILIWCCRIFVFVAGVGACGTLSNYMYMYNVLIQKSEIQRQCSYEAIAIKNNDAVLVIK